jgi:hypothetical protein
LKRHAYKGERDESSVPHLVQVQDLTVLVIAEYDSCSGKAAAEDKGPLARYREKLGAETMPLMGVNKTAWMSTHRRITSCFASECNLAALLAKSIATSSSL